MRSSHRAWRGIIKRGRRCSSKGALSGGELLHDSLGSLLLGQSEVTQPLSVLGVLVDSGGSGDDDLSSRLLVSGELLPVGVGNDGLVDLLVKFLAGLGLVGGQALLPLRELSLELGGVLLLELVHVGGDVHSEDSVSVNLGVVGGLGLLVVNSLSSLVGHSLDLGLGVSGESLGGVGHVDTSVASSLEGTEESGSSGGGRDTDIEESLEGPLVLDVLLNVEHGSVDLVVGLVHLGESDLLEQSPGDQEAGAVGGGVVGESGGETVVLELGGVSGAKHSISGHGGVDDLADDLSAGSSDDESVLLGVVLVLLLHDQSPSSVEVGLALSSPLGLDLHPHRVSLVLDDLNETHLF
mmetsp:Transcript_13174/g.22336  ORF Transcript_13174/g.22336 Transcript_13174/m.22336 type:complete len:352 (+) Transcript_13174:108-1163(+)